MNRLWLGLGLLLGVIGIVGAQQISMPPPAGVFGIACAYNASPPTLTTSNPGWVQCDSTGKIITSGTASGANVGATGAAVPASAGYDGINVAGILRGWTGSNPSGSIFAGQVDVAAIAGTTTATGSGAMNAGTQRTALATDSPGIIALGQTTKSASVPVTIASDQYVDPCQSPNVAKSSVPINITTATTTSLVAVSGSTIVYVCGVSITVSEVITTPNTILFEYGTGAACTGPVVLTGKFGDGGVTAGIPIVIGSGSGMTIFKSAASAGICALTAVGATASFQGVMTYVQQ